MSRVNVYFTDAGVYIISTARTRMGAITDAEPIIVLAVDVDATSLGAAVITALEAHQELVDDFSPAVDFNECIRKATPYRSLAALERAARSEVVNGDGDEATIYPTTFVRGQGFLPVPGDVRLAVEPHAIGSAMLAVLPLCKNETLNHAGNGRGRG